MKIETRSLLAARYLKRDTAFLTHAFKVEKGVAVKSLCGIKGEAAADPFAGDTTAEPTCPRCNRLVPGAVSRFTKG